MVLNSWDAVIIPGGKLGAENISKSTILIDLLKNQKSSGKLYAAICASPAIVLHPHNFLNGEKATCYPTFKHILAEEYVDSKVVVSNNLSNSFLKIDKKEMT